MTLFLQNILLVLTLSLSFIIASPVASASSVASASPVVSQGSTSHAPQAQTGYRNAAYFVNWYVSSHSF